MKRIETELEPNDLKEIKKVLFFLFKKCKIEVSSLMLKEEYFLEIQPIINKWRDND